MNKPWTEWSNKNNGPDPPTQKAIGQPVPQDVSAEPLFYFHLSPSLSSFLQIYNEMVQQQNEMLHAAGIKWTEAMNEKEI